MLLCCLGPGLFAQTEDPAMKSRLERYLSLLQSGQYESATAYMYPRMFDHISKAMVVEAMKSTMESPEIRIYFDSLKPGFFEKPIAVKDARYALMRYDSYLSMELKAAEAQSAEEQQERSETTFEMLRIRYGEENVRLDEITGRFLISSSSSLLAIRDAQSPEWTFLRVTQDASQWGTFFPKKVVKKIQAKL